MASWPIPPVAENTNGVKELFSPLGVVIHKPSSLNTHASYKLFEDLMHCWKQQVD